MPRKNDAEGSALTTPSIGLAPTTATIQEQPTQPVSTEVDEGDRGVLRLLEAGHFRGVADVRLRINFHEALQARATSETQVALTAGAARLTADLGATIDELFGSPDVGDDTTTALAGLVGGFGESVDAAVTGGTAAGTVNPDALRTSLDVAFEDLVSGLTYLFAVPTPASLEPAEPNSDPPVAADPGSTDDAAPAGPSEAFDTAVAALREAFAGLVDGLLGTVAQTGDLPPPSPPNSQGAAYARFLAQYEALFAPGGSVNEPA